MLAALAVPYRDTTAADLLVAVRAGTSAPDGLRAIAAQSGSFLLDLRVLGASHAVVARAPDGTALTEVVACTAAAGTPLASAVRAAGGVEHRFAACVERGSVAARAAALRALAADPAVLVAAFPGAPDALTAVRALPAGPGTAAWETWHLYPGTAEAVRTTTTLEHVGARAALAEAAR